MTIYSFDVLLSWCGNQSVVPCPVLTVASWPAYRFSGSRSGGLLFPSLEEFFSLLWSTQSKAFGVVNKIEEDVFLELSCFIDDPVDVGDLISSSSAFSKSSLNVWKFTVHVRLKRGLENFEHYFASMWDECNCVVVWAFFWDCLSLGLEWKCFPDLWPLLSFPNLLAYWVQHFHSIIF